MLLTIKGFRTGILSCPLRGPLHSHQAFALTVVLSLGRTVCGIKAPPLLFTLFFLVKADFCVFCENPFGGTAHTAFQQVSPILMRISLYYSAHFLNLTLIKCILYFIITNKQLAVLKIYGWVLRWLMTVSAFQFQMRFRVSGLSGKLIAVENLAQAVLTQTSLGPAASSRLLFLDRLPGKWSEEWKKGREKEEGWGRVECHPFPRVFPPSSGTGLEGSWTFFPA